MEFDVELQRWTEARKRQERRLEAFAREARKLLFVRGLFTVLAWLVGLALLSFALDRLLRLSVGTRVVLGLAAAGYLGWIVLRDLVGPISGSWRSLDLASALDRSLPGAPGPSYLTQRLATAVQLESRVRDQHEDSALLLRALERSHTELDAYDFESHLDRRTGRSRMVRVAGLLLLPLLLAVSFNDTAGLWFRRWFLGSSERWPQDTYLEVVGLRDGKLVVARSEPFELQVRAIDDSVVPESVEVQFEIGNGGRERGMAPRFGDNDFRYAFPAIETDAELWVRGGDERLGPIPILAAERPRVAEYHLFASLPEADFEEDRVFQGQDRDQAYLHGTRMRLECTTDQAITGLSVASEGESELAAEPMGPKRFSVSWTHVDGVPLEFEFESVETGLASRQQRVTLGLRVDRRPRVTLTQAGVGERVTPSARIPCSILAQDDLGLERLELELQVALSFQGGQGPTTRHVYPLLEDPGAEETSIEQSKEVDLAEHGLQVGSVLRLTAEGLDQCHLGAQLGRSRTLTLRVVEPAQLMAEITQRLQQVRGQFRISYEDARALLGDFDRDGSVEAISEVLRRHRLVDRTTWSTSRTVAASLTEMTLNGLIEAQAVELLEARVLEPLELLREEALREQRADFERLYNGEAVDFEGVRNRQGRIVDSMANILEGMERWDSFVDLVNQLNEVIRMQDLLREETLSSGD